MVAPSPIAAIDMLDIDAALASMLASHAAAVEVVSTALPAIAQGAVLMADAIASGSVLHYAAAGSSGLMALADASELPGTFGIPQAQIAIHMAGGVPSDGSMPGDTEDLAIDAQRDAAKLLEGDIAIVISASGTTPYALAFAHSARARKARVISIVNVAQSELLDIADVAIALPTAPEVIDGSTRLGASTAQKAALNMMSTQMGIHLGHVHDGLMVNLIPDNTKLRRRAVDIVCRIARVSPSTAEHALNETGYQIKTAALVALGTPLRDANDLLARHSGRLRATLSAVDFADKL